MPSISSPSKVLVSGANGYIATWIVRALLERGYAVRGTVRSLVKGEHLKNTFKSYSNQLEIVVVDDITKDGAFDEAVKGVDAIAHTASPVQLSVSDPQELILPAVKGTVGMLTSAAKYGSSVRRIVVTSSCAAIMRSEPETITLSEVDWNEQSPKEVEEKGQDASAFAKYRTSKVLAEKAAWNFYETQKSELPWDLTMINPPWVFGPFIHDVPSLNALNTSAKLWYNVVAQMDKGGLSSDAILTQPGHGWVDVRDLAEAHVLALEVEAAGGERIIISAGSCVWQDFINAAQSVSTSRTLPKAVPGDTRYAIVFDTSKEKRLLGLKFRTMEETARDVLSDFDRLEW
ncbi:D-lactaldehyde dehydrogenase [Guyanagaster necrorhizus]|uniref:D-lactaldehyde dehydrogenase n=1 Tax=Guyanagaster necrorhizus TaxID=856835 RepID=A0A9P8AUK2_9AGAR|nr:D-lactaldehyde dehydrogenase [Guyanagaster necrorhizus MCA 3950]KAG7448146.1 D-lactaldehyde dehydrogenase [Guyanagaster necrorhizus MCA 3950]